MDKHKEIPLTDPLQHPAFLLGKIYGQLGCLKGSPEPGDLEREKRLKAQLKELLDKHPTLDIAPEYYNAMKRSLE